MRTTSGIGRLPVSATIVGALSILVLAAVTLVSAGVSAAADPSAGCTTTSGVTTCVFAYTGAAQTWTVPAGVTSVTVELYGAQGGSGIVDGDLGVGGLGGYASAALAVTPAETLQVNVGGKGGDRPDRAGGFNGGGAADYVTLAGGGGGASDVRRGAFALADRLLVAGGGGGGSSYGLSYGGGGGSGTIGTDGANGSGFTAAGGGEGATQDHGGFGGFASDPDGAVQGFNGKLGVGGAGGPGNSAGGGGGGGGYYGGGGGGGSRFGWSGSGGGGSGFGATQSLTGVHIGNGLVTITYTEPSVSPSPQVGLAPASLSFGDQLVGSASLAKTVTVSNTGSAPLTLDVLSVGGANPGEFSIVSGSDSCSMATLAPAGACAVDVRFSPTAAGARSASLLVPSNAASSPTDSVALSGNGTLPAPPSVGLSPASVGFADQLVGSASFRLPVAIINTGGSPLVLNAISIGGVNSADFKLDNTGCSGADAILAPGANCAVGVSFMPTAAGARTASLVVASNAASTPDTVALSGNGTLPAPPTVGLSPSSVAFGDQLVGTTSAAHTVTISNTAPADGQPLALGPLSLGGANPGEFSIVFGTDGCSNAILAPGGHCTVDVRFAPTQAASRSASLSIPSNAASSPDTVALSGNGTAVPVADVKVSISGPTSALAGSQNTYLVNISNAGPAKALGVAMTLQVPNGTKYVGVSTTQGSCTHPASGATSGTIRCSLGDLASGAAALDSVALKLALTGKGGSIAVVAQAASASTPDPDLSNNVASLTTTIKKK